ncbi:hypothetical protein QE410_001190 [Microbacterium sp. SORGH_AS 1204]|nr:hypothetical protein [Microbacterium sp. SORGH_AS_1204]
MTPPPHLHAAGHLAAGGVRRCGCAPAHAAEPPVLPAPAAQLAWTPFRRKRVAFVRAHLIYSDRMLRLGA